MVAGSVRPHGRGWLAFIPCVRHIPICYGCTDLAFSNGGRARQVYSIASPRKEDCASLGSVDECKVPLDHLWWHDIHSPTDFFCVPAATAAL
jgi:hypothetical protein